jgi:HEAT repeat protein
MSHDNTYIRRIVVRVLGKLGGKKAISALIKATSDKDFWIRFHAIESIGQLGNLETIDLLEKLKENDTAQEGNHTISDIAAKAIENIKAIYRK